MIVQTLRGSTWQVEHAQKKLAWRAELPGARVFDLAADALRRAKESGVALEDRFTLALPASWLVNSPAVSRVLKRWALAPARDAWLDVAAAVEGDVDAEDTRAAISARFASLGDEPYLVEAASKVLALLSPRAVPLMPPPACAFVLGDAATAEVGTFLAMLSWFRRAVDANEAELTRVAAAHAPVRLDAAQVLDRLLWFDSDGKKHFPAP